MNCVQQIVGVFSVASLAMILAITPGYCDETQEAITYRDVHFEVTA